MASRYLLGRKLRTFLTTLAIVFGVFLIFGMNILIPTMVQSLQANMLAASGQVDVTITQVTGAAFPASTVERVASVEGVRLAAGTLQRNVNLPPDYYDRDPATPDKITVLSLVGLDPETAPALRYYPLEQGRFLQADDTHSAVITTSLADALGLELGDSLKLPTTQGEVSLTIVGLLPARAMPGNEEVMVPLAEAQTLLSQPGQINAIEANLNTTDEGRRAEIIQAIQDTLGDTYHLGALPSGAEMLASLQMGEVSVNLFGFVALLMGGFIIFNTFRTVVAERRRDIGVLRSVGASRRTIIGLILAEGLLQGVAGTLAGVILGYLFGLGVLKLSEPVFASYLNLRLGAPVVNMPTLIAAGVLGIGVTLLAGLIPALSASRVTPLEALRPPVAEVSAPFRVKPGPVIGGVLLVVAMLGLISKDIRLTSLGILLFIVGLVMLAPALVTPLARLFGSLLSVLFARDGTGSLAQANLSRQPTRAAVTASATMIGLALLIAMVGLMSSITVYFEDVVRKSLGSDFLLLPPSVAVWGSDVGANPELAEQLRQVEGVGAVSTLRVGVTASDDGAALTLLGIDPHTFPQVGGLVFQSGDPETAYEELASGRTLILNNIFAAQNQLGVGDEVELVTPHGRQTYRVIGVAGDYFNAKVSVAYISQANLAADFDREEDVLIQLNLAPGADPEAVESALREITAPYPQFALINGREYLEQTIQLFRVAFLVFDILLAVLALPSLIAMLNTLAIAVIERTREIGMLRATGATRRQVRRMILAEALLLAALGTAFGMLAGLYLGYGLTGAINVAGFPLAYSFPAAGLIAAIAVGLLFGALAAIIPARQAARLEIVQALRYE
jgi:putative ABC transport system permease protein